MPPAPPDSVPLVRRSSALAALTVVVVALLIQTGSAFAGRLIGLVGVIAALWLRTVLAAVILVALRPRSLRLPPPESRVLVAALTLSLLWMNASFYAAISRAPLGVVVAVEFLGPLVVAVLGHRRPLDFAWIGLAGVGVALLAGPAGSVSTAGLLLALCAAVGWAAYLLLAKRAVATMQPLPVVTIMLIGSGMLLTPFLLIGGPGLRAVGSALGLGALVALLSSALPYLLELLALRRVRAATYSVLLSIEPAVAAITGFIILGQRLTRTEIVAIAAVALAAGGAGWSSGSRGG
jgi:inner membrane transporter RhtA